MNKSILGPLLFSPKKCYKSGSANLFSPIPIPFLSLCRYFDAKPNVDCKKSKLYSEKNISRLDDALDFYNKLVRRNPLPCVQEFNKLLSHIVKLKEYSFVISRFKDMCFLGIPVDEYTLNIVINAYCNCNKLDYGFSKLGCFFKRGLEPNGATFSTLLKALFKQNRVLEAQELFTKIETESLCELNVVVYGVTIDGLCKAGNTSRAFEIFREMERKSCMPNVWIYTAIINGLCNDRSVDYAVRLFYEMLKKGVVPNVIAYNSLIHGLCNSSKLKEAKVLMKEMTNWKIYPDNITYNVLIDALCKEGLVSEAEDVVLKMKEKNWGPDLVTYNALVNGYCLQNRVDEARKVFDSITPDIFSYNILINGYCKMDKIEEALHLFRIL
ncbi:hypothetical protein ACJIZ3_013826 [Penstemon smallii]|uniref:Pentatricopeptide repeat-containing protein n=1 Tax=Penstemon smallii TaxID=265156 RepID=A0ABD3RI57_9LAMI